MEQSQTQPGQAPVIPRHELPGRIVLTIGLIPPERAAVRRPSYGFVRLSSGGSTAVLANEVLTRTQKA